MNNDKFEKDEFIEKVKSEKHNFLDHLHTVYGIAQLKKYKRIKQYIQSVNADLLNSRSNQTSNYNFILISILMIKERQAVNNGIKFEYKVDKNFENLNISLNTIFRIIFNLINIAIKTLKNFDGQGKIEVQAKTGKNRYLLSVYNNGPIIREELIDKVFHSNFSTQDLSREYSLYITKKLVENVEGKLIVKSEKEFGTKFTCYF